MIKEKVTRREDEYYNVDENGRIVMREESRTSQSAKDECDINKIVARAKAGEDITYLQRNPQLVYADLSEVPTDLREAMAIVTQAESLFMAMPANVRERFGNDPVKMIEFLGDEKNRKEAIELGLVKAPVVDQTLETLRSIETTLKASSDADSTEAKPAGEKA